MIIKNNKLIRVELEDNKTGLIIIPKNVTKISSKAFDIFRTYIIFDEEKQRYVRKTDSTIKMLVLPQALVNDNLNVKEDVVRKKFNIPSEIENISYMIDVEKMQKQETLNN